MPENPKIRLWPFDLGYVFFVLLLFKEVVLDSALFTSVDNMQIFYPMGKVIAQAFKGNGSFLWDSGSDYGLPIIGRWQTQMFYPTTWLLAFLSPTAAWAFSYLVHMVVAASATFRLAFRYSNDIVSAWIAGLGFACCGYVLSMTSFGFRAIGVSLLPVGLLFIHRLCEKPNLNRAVALALVFSLQIFAADAETLFYELLLCTPIILLFRSGSKTGLVRAGLWLVAGGMLAAVIGACQILPMFEFTSLSERSAGLAFKEASYWSFNPLRLVEYVVPHVFGTVFPVFNWWNRAVIHGPSQIPWAVCIYIGVLPIAGLVVLLFEKRTRETAMWGVMFLAFFFLALGAYSPIYEFVFSILPGANKFRYPEKFIPFVSLSLCILGAAGFGLLIKRGQTRTKARYSVLVFLAFVGISLLAVLAVLGWTPDSEKWFGSFITAHNSLADPSTAWEQTGWAVRRSLAIVLTLFAVIFLAPRIKPSLMSIILVLLASTDILTAGLPVRQISGDGWLKSPPNTCSIIPRKENHPPPTVWRPLDEYSPLQNAGESGDEYAERFRKWKYETLLPNVGAPMCVRYTDGYSTGQLYRHLQLFRAFNDRYKDLLTVAGVQYVFNINKRYPAFFKDMPVFKEINDLDLDIYSYSGRPYVHPAGEILRVPDMKTGLQLISDESYDPARKTIIESTVALPVAGKGTTGVDLISWKSGRMDLWTNYSEPGYAVVHESYYPGWSARLESDGRALKILPANIAFLAVEVPAGRQKIILEFNPRLQKTANILSMLGLFSAVLLLTASTIKRRRTAEHP